MIEQNRNEFEKAHISHWHRRGYTGKGSTIVVLDDRSTPRLEDNIVVPYPDNHEDIVKHNTNVCGVLRQVAPDATIITFNWFREKQETIDWILEHENEIDVINCSFSSSRQMAERLKQVSHIPLICSSGNGGQGAWADYPAYFDWTIAVGAWEERGHRLADYSSGGKMLDCVAYTDIYIPLYRDNDTLMFSGTSCAAPVVSGMLALYIGWRKEKGLPKLSREDIRRFIHKNSQDVLEQGRDDKTGHGLFVLPEISKVEGEQMMEKMKDIRGHWAEKEIRQVVAAGLMVGDDKGNFNPNTPLTRAEFATVLARLTNKGAK